MLSLASEADIDPVDLNEEGVALSTLLEEGDDGGDGAFGFQEANPCGFGRGTGAGPTGVDAVADFSKAAILSRMEPGFGLGGC